MTTRNRHGLRLLLIVGAHRPAHDPDFGEVLLARLLRTRHEVSGLILAEGDELIDTARRRGVPVLLLPPELQGARRSIATATRDAPLDPPLAAWLRSLADLRPDLGICFYGPWIPPQVLAIPPRGFLNYHPGPLPELRGMEPDTFAVLEGRAYTHGTVHLMSEDFDAGPIVLRTSPVRLGRYTTPFSLVRTLTRKGVGTLVRAVHALAAGTAVLEPQDSSRVTLATRRRAVREALLDLARDDSVMVGRRLRAFRGQDAGIELRAELAGQVYPVLDAETWVGSFPGRPGELLGRYAGPGRFAGGPVIRIRDGLAVLSVGQPLTENAAGREPANPPSRPLIRGGPRRRRTRLAVVLRSLPRGENGP